MLQHMTKYWPEARSANSVRRHREPIVGISHVMD
jgi:hypothetical protein